MPWKILDALGQTRPSGWDGASAEPIRMSFAVMGKSKSWFDLNHDRITGDDSIWVQKIWFRKMSFNLDSITFYVIWFGHLNKAQLSVTWAKE